MNCFYHLIRKVGWPIIIQALGYGRLRHETIGWCEECGLSSPFLYGHHRLCYHHARVHPAAKMMGKSTKQ